MRIYKTQETLKRGCNAGIFIVHGEKLEAAYKRFLRSLTRIKNLNVRGCLGAI